MGKLPFNPITNYQLPITNYPMDKTIFKLKVKQVGSICNFELSWGAGQIISVDLHYPLSLVNCYEQWQRAYLNYYRRLRGRVIQKGSGNIPVDRHKELVNAEAQLLDEFHRWLLSPELVSIRREIAKAASKKRPETEYRWVEVFLTCTPLELAKLPWETWEIGTDLGTAEKIRIARTPANILNEPVRQIRRKARILAILGDDTGLSFEEDKKAVRSLNSIADIEFVGWKPDQEKTEHNTWDGNALKAEIVQAIADERGWDILFFAGHSNETALTGGELGIAPYTSISIQEIEHSLKQAKKRGLQFAIFNSCSGLNIAESLINLGLSQVAIMREPIHNQVAQEFLKQFLQSLAKYKDVHAALLEACDLLKQQEKRLNYPSTYLVPSLFRHPEAELFCIKDFGVLDVVKRWIPAKQEAKWLAVFLLISLVPYLQDLLLEQRLFFQAIYRQATGQVPREEKPPVRLIHIDETSIAKAKIPWQKRKPMDRSYLAKILERVYDYNPKFVSIDYKIWEPTNTQDDDKLGKAIRAGVKKGIWFTLAAKVNEAGTEEVNVIPEKIASLNWSMQGDINLYPGYVELLPAGGDCSKICPFAYLQTLTYVMNQEPISNLRQPQLQSKTNWRQQFIKEINAQPKQNNRLNYLKQLRLLPISTFSDLFMQMWLHPIVDFSIPPDQVYKSTPAWCLLESNSGCNISDRRQFQQQIVAIAPKGYEEADDNFNIPLAIQFWRQGAGGKFSGSEYHAYMMHHFLTQRLVVPIPDFWTILLAALLGKGIVLILVDNPSQRQKWLIGLGGATAVYIIVSLQVYISAAVLFPWFLPSAVLWNYFRLALIQTSRRFL
jgi:CHASE2 domain-containing sensor protein